MNLHQVVRGAIQTVNPDYKAKLIQSTGYTTTPSGKQVPTWAVHYDVPIQIQANAGGSLSKVDNINQQGITRSVFLNGYWAGVVRADSTGGDMFEFPIQTGGEMRQWMVTSVAETWADWSHVIVTLQVNTLVINPQ